jgi:hypothetical protein
MSDASGPMVADLDGTTPTSGPLSRVLWSTRLLSLAALAMFLALLWRGAAAAYYAATDSYVAPIILSPDSEAVIQNRLNLSRLRTDRQNLRVRADEAADSIEAIDSALSLLRELRQASSQSLTWASKITDGQEARGHSEMEILRAQRAEIAATLARQEKYVADMEQGQAVGLVHRADVERERSVLNNLRVAMLQNQRENANSGTQLQTTLLAQRALKSRSRALDTPEMFSQRENLTRVRIEVLRYEAERRGRAAQMQADLESLARLDELITQLEARPVFRAAEGKQNVAFVTYKEMAGISPGSDVVRCEMWGIIGCKRVGTVSELLPGEVTMADPWGTVGRGQYALLDLTDSSAAQSRSLRVRRAGSNASGLASLTPLPAGR